VYVTALLTLFVALGYLVWQQRQTAASLEMIAAAYLPLSKVAARLDRDRQRVSNDLDRLLREERRPGRGSSSPTAIYTETFQKNVQVGRDYVVVARRLAASPEEVAVLNKATIHLDRIDRYAQQYEEASKRLVEAVEAGRAEETDALMPDLQVAGEELVKEVEQLSQLVDGRVSALTAATEAAQVRGTAVAAFLALVAVAVSSALIVAIVVAIRPIGRLTAQIQRLAAGERIEGVSVRGSDEVAVLAREFDTMAAALRERDQRLTERAEELRTLSRYLESVLDALGEALLVVDHGRVSLANPAAHRVFQANKGSTAPAELHGLAAGRHEMSRPDGTLYEVRVSPFGETGVVVVATDVTEQTATRDRLARSERLALIGQMLAQITHEVRNPLNALSLNAELMADELGELDPEHRAEAWDLLETISGEVDRLTKVTGHYLQLARRPPSLLVGTDLHALVDDVARLVRPELEQAGVTLTTRGNRLAPVLADGNQLRQALWNVIRNAVEAGAHHLTLDVDADVQEIRLILSDDGSGMDPAQAARAFDPFWSSKATGTGLGLAITKQILEDHGGTVRVETAPGAGCRLTLAWPRRGAPVHEEPAHEAES
jgi:signal transduction histidine kinase